MILYSHMIHHTLMHVVSLGKDYGPVIPDVVSFNQFSNRSCVTIQIVDDFLFEDTESIYASLELPAAAERISVRPNLTRIQIEDDDSE